MNIKQITIIEDGSVHKDWQTLLDLYETDVFHSPGWLNSIVETYGFEINAFIVVDESDKPVAGIPYCKIDDMLDPRIVSLPFSDFCDPLVSTKEQWEMLAEKFLEFDVPLTFKCLHNEVPLNDERIPMAGRDKWHCIELNTTSEALWDNIHSSARRAIRKARKNGITVRVGETKEDLRSFFELHLRIRKFKYELVAQPPEFFENIWDNFMAKGNGALFLAEHEGKVIGGIFSLVWNNRFYYKFNASDTTNVKLRPNDLMLWTAAEYGIEKGYDYLDFGLSSWDQEGLIRYKEKYATRVGQVSFIKSTPSHGWSERNNRIRSLLPQLTDLFVDPSVPNEITEKAGQVLYRFFT